MELLDNTLDFLGKLVSIHEFVPLGFVSSLVDPDVYFHPPTLYRRRVLRSDRHLGVVDGQVGGRELISLARLGGHGGSGVVRLGGLLFLNACDSIYICNELDAEGVYRRQEHS